MKPPPSARLIRGHRLSQGIVGLWLFNEGSGGQVFDLSRNNNTGAFGAGAASPTWSSGKFGSALSFDGGDYVNCGNNPSLDISTYLSGSAWVYLLADTTGYIACKRDGDTCSWGIYYSNATKGLHLFGSDNISMVDSVQTLSLLQWYHVVWVMSGTTGYIYIDGVLDSSDTIAAVSLESAIRVIIGARWNVYPDVSININAIIDHLNIYNHTRNASEIALLYREPFCMFERKARTALLSGYTIPPVGNAGIMTPNTGYWGPTF